MKINRFPKKLGFTLIELMVVIGILAALMAIGTPLLLSRLAAADTTACQANMKQLTQLGLQYQTDFAHKNMLPTSGMDDDEDTEEIDESEAWWYSIAPMLDDYVAPSGGRAEMKIARLFHCKADIRFMPGSERTIPGTTKAVSYVSWTDASEDRENVNSRIYTGAKQRLDEMPWLSDGIPVKGESVKNVEDFKSMVLPALERHENTIVVGYASGVIKAIELDPEEEDAFKSFKKIAPWLAENPNDEPKKSSKKKSSR